MYSFRCDSISFFALRYLFCLIDLFVLFRNVWSGTKTPLWRQKDSLLLILFRFIRKYFARVGVLSFLSRSHFTFIDRIRREIFLFFPLTLSTCNDNAKLSPFFLSSWTHEMCSMISTGRCAEIRFSTHTHKGKPTTRMKELD